MKKILFLLVAILSVSLLNAAAITKSAPAFRGKNLIRNAEFKGTDTDIGIWNNNLGKFGDTCALFVRSAKAPNKLSRKITGLVPGKIYSVSWVTANADDIANKRYGTPEAEISLDATLDGATVIPGLCYDMRTGGKQFQDNPVEIQSRKLIFKADKKEVVITFSDWKNDRETGGAAGVRRVLNFIQCTPYYDENF